MNPCFNTCVKNRSAIFLGLCMIQAVPLSLAIIYSKSIQTELTKIIILYILNFT